MSVADLLKGNFIDGGPLFMTLVYIMWVLVIILTIKFLRNHRSKDRDLKNLKSLTPQFFYWCVCISFSLFYRNLGIYGALSTIVDAQDISPSILANGLRVSYIAPLYSFFLFLVTSLIWFLFRNKIKA